MTMDKIHVVRTRFYEIIVLNDNVKMDGKKKKKKTIEGPSQM